MSKNSLPKDETVDLPFLRNITNGDSEFEKELYEIFLDSSNNNVSRMQKSIDESLDDEWYLASHSFKGAASSIGAFKLSKILADAQIHKEEDIEKKSDILQKVRDELELVLDFLSKKL